jgi:hypothetical protein
MGMTGCLGTRPTTTELEGSDFYVGLYTVPKELVVVIRGTAQD